ncbi:MAG: aspartate kinase [Oscillospiraceae bacterium]|nr:aspartate kinase [Oscillospiraceae bacterium]MCL2278430.1 aspartate kinase [Oscillospiraceae bacterium]
MALIVKKFGGSSVANAECLKRVAWTIAESYSEGNNVVVVLSAQADTTDELISKAFELNDTPSKREMDVLLSTGEQASVALMAITLEKLGLPAVSLTGWQIGMNTDSAYGSARIKSVATERMKAELDRRRIVLVAGFQGVNKYDDITTIGRGGSDTTAVAVAVALNADLCQIYTDVDGIYTADPRLVKNAKKLDEITYDEMIELAAQGAQVLHSRSVEMAKRYGVEMEVLSSLKREPGTKVRGVNKVEHTKISGVAKDANLARVSIIGIRDEPGVAFKIFRVIANAKKNIDIILQSANNNSANDISFTVAREDLVSVVEILEENKSIIGFSEIKTSDNIAKVSIVGAGMMSAPGIAAAMFEALYDVKVNIEMIATSEIKISVLVNENDADRAVSALHEKFFD